MDAKPRPLQFRLRSLFRLTTRVAIIAGVYAMLPKWLQVDVAMFVGALAVSFLIMTAELIVILLIQASYRRVKRWANRLPERRPTTLIFPNER